MCSYFLRGPKSPISACMQLFLECFVVCERCLAVFLFGKWFDLDASADGWRGEGGSGGVQKSRCLFCHCQDGKYDVPEESVARNASCA